MKIRKTIGVILVALTVVQVLFGLVMLYLWGFGLIVAPEYVAAPLMYGPIATGVGAGWPGWWSR